MTLRPGEVAGRAIAVFPFLKTTDPITLGAFTFRSTDDTTGLDAEDAAHVREIADMLYLQDDLRIQSATTSRSVPACISSSAYQLPSRVNSLSLPLVQKTPVRSFQIKQEFERPFLASHCDPLTPYDRRKGSEPLLAVEQQTGASRFIGAFLLGNGEILKRHLLIGFPEQDGAGRIATIERIKKVTHTR
jgi:hypothetical protein